MSVPTPNPAHRQPCTRLAPSPTGALHLGNARTFLVNWLLARQNGWRVVLRIDDLDGPRVKPGAAEQAVDDLRWLGIDWDAGPVLQSTFAASHRAALEELVASRQVYPCVCTRAEVERAASAPHAEDGAAVYPGTCRGRFEGADAARRATGREPAWRFAVADDPVEFDDAFAGPQRYDRPRAQLGDFVVAKSDATPAYQLATVVDDAAAGVTHVVRGDDLLDSTPRQMLLYRALGLADRIPSYTHLPLVVGPDGRRLAKRHGDTRLSFYRDRGLAAGRVVALLARWCGVEAGDAITPRELLGQFDLAHVSRERVTFAAADDAWLRGGR
jgi:glutamyl-tRNA synthetase